jgi:hypothetical protein
MHTQECRRQVLGRCGFVLIELCNCGAAHVTLGAVTLRLAPEAIAELAEAAGDAARELALREAFAEYRAARAEALS